MIHTPNYSFADLLHIFYALRLYPERIRTYEDFAQALGVSRRTLAGWFAGDYTPRTPDVVMNIGRVLGLTALQADLLFYAVDPGWVRHGTPMEVLKNIELIRYREHLLPYPLPAGEPPPTITEIEREWDLVFEDKF